MMPGIDPRRMQMMMRQMGVQMDDVPDVKEVIVRTATKEYRIRRATVSIMKAQGTETWQVQGKAEVIDLPTGDTAASSPSAPGSSSASPSAPSGSARSGSSSSSSPSASSRTPSSPRNDAAGAAGDAEGSGDDEGVPIGASGPAAPLEIPDLDVRLVMEQTGKDRATCLKALQDGNGDIAAAIVALGG